MNALSRITIAISISAAVIMSGAAAAPAAQADKGMVDQKALDILKRMSDTISGAKSVSFEACSIVPIRTPRGVWISLFGDSRVVMKGRDKLYARTGGDFSPYDFYFDGKTVTAYAPDKNLYAEKPMAGDIDSLIEGAYKEEGRSFPYADLLLARPYDVLTEGLTRAVYVGRSSVGRGKVETDHLVFSNKGVDWQIWVDAATNLPVMVSATYLDDASEPSYGVEFFDWKIDAPVDDGVFAYKNATGAKKVEFRHPAYPGRLSRAAGKVKDAGREGAI